MLSIVIPTFNELKLPFLENSLKTLSKLRDEGHEFELPAMMVEQEFEMIVKQMEQERHQQMHAESEKHDCCDADGNCSSTIDAKEKEELKTIAQRRVKLGLVLSQIGEQNDIKVTQDDLQKAVIAEAQKYPGQEAQVFEFYQKNKNALDSLRAPIFEEKTVDFIVELAKVTEKKMSVDELTADDDAISETAKKSKATTKKKPAAKKK